MKKQLSHGQICGTSRPVPLKLKSVKIKTFIHGFVTFAFLNMGYGVIIEFVLVIMRIT